MIAEALRPERFASLSALQTEHSALQASLGKQPIDGSHAQIIAPLVQRAVETGAILDNREDRQSAQAIINYWMSRAAASVRLESSAPNPFADPDFDSLLKDFDSGTLTDTTAAADRWLQSLPDEHRQVARRILLRLARLPADKRVFEAVPTSRTSLHDVDADTCLVDRMIDGLAQAGVIRVTPGSSTEVDQVALRSGNLVTEWNTYAEWLRARVEFRERAETWSLMRQQEVPTCWRTKLGLPTFNSVNEQQLPVPPLLCDAALQEVRSYHDRNPLERRYIETCWLRERSKSQSDRTWKLIFGSLLLFSVCCLLFANNRWSDANKQRGIAEKQRTEATKQKDEAIAQKGVADQALADLKVAIEKEKAATLAAQESEKAAITAVKQETAAKDEALFSSIRESAAKNESIRILEQLIDAKSRGEIADNPDLLEKYSERLKVLRNNQNILKELHDTTGPIRPGCILYIKEGDHMREQGSACCIVRDDLGNRYAVLFGGVGHAYSVGTMDVYRGVTHIGRLMNESEMPRKSETIHAQPSAADLGYRDYMGFVPIPPNVAATNILPLEGRSIVGLAETCRVGDSVTIIGAGSGVSNGATIQRMQPDGTIHYTRVTKVGDGGGPVLNAKLELIAMHLGGKSDYSFGYLLASMLKDLGLTLVIDPPSEPED